MNLFAWNKYGINIAAAYLGCFANRVVQLVFDMMEKAY